jgi:hypothetical protein
LAIPETAWQQFFQKRIIQMSLQRIGAKILIYNPINNSYNFYGKI